MSGIRFVALLTTVLVSVHVPASELLLDSQFRIQHLEQMPQPQSIDGLEIEPRHFSEFDAVHWQIGLHADSTTAQPLIENFLSADFVIRFPEPADLTLHWSNGSHAQVTDFQPQSQTLNESELALESFGGRSSDGNMPFFNVASSSAFERQGGLIVAVGWSGDWQARFQKVDGDKLRVRAGLKRTRFRLDPNETVQLPSILLMSYHGRAVDGQNKFRRLLLKHFTPNNHPVPKLMPVAASVHGMLAFNDTNETNLLELAGEIAETKLPLDTFWLDAGWNQGGFPTGQGNHLPDKTRFPNGLSPLGSALKRTDMRFLLWFEPERAMRRTFLDESHAEWLLKPTATPVELRYMENDGFQLLDLANPQARQWALDVVSQEIEQSQVAIYRQDCNLYPAYYWHAGESADSVGLHEVRYITGLYDFLDRLRQEHPALIIDSCASGGRRLDIELMARSVCLWRSDSCWDAPSYPRNVQAMSHGLSNWLPLHGLGSVATDPVSLRSGMGPCASFAINYRDPTAVSQLSEHLEKYLPVRELFTADYYPLTKWSTNSEEWLAFQHHDPNTGRGIVQAFHGASSTSDSLQLKFEGLDAQTIYVLDDWDDPTSSLTATGEELATSGISVNSRTDTNEARVWQYHPL